MSQDTVATTGTDTEVVELPAITPFKAAKVATLILGRKIEPQTFYGYHKRAVIKPVTLPGDKKKYFDGAAFKEWLDEQKANPGTSSAKMDVNALAAMFGDEVEDETSETDAA